MRKPKRITPEETVKKIKILIEVYEQSIERKLKNIKTYAQEKPIKNNYFSNRKLIDNLHIIQSDIRETEDDKRILRILKRLLEE